MEKWIVIVFIALGCGTVKTSAQRHYIGVRAIETCYGLNIFGRDNTSLSVSISRYKKTTYWKGGFNFLEKSFTYKVPYGEACSTGRTYYFDANYFKTLTTNRTNVWINGGVGAFIGTEVYNNPEEQIRFISGPKIDVECEFFVTSRISLLGHLEQQWSPFSQLKKWNTLWGVGIKYLLY